MESTIFHSLPLLSKPSLSTLPRKHRRHRFTVKSSHKHKISLRLSPTPISSSSLGVRLARAPKALESLPFSKNFPTFAQESLNSVRKSIAFALFCVAVGFLPVHLLQKHASAAAMPVASVVPRDDVRGKKAASNSTDHEFSGYTRRLLEAVSVLLQRIEDVKSGNGDMNAVKEALKGVVARRGELQGEMLSVLNAELRELRRERAELMKRAAEVIDLVLEAKKERDKLLRSQEEDSQKEKLKEKVERLESSMIAAEEEYNGIWEKVGEIEDKILKRETLTYSVGVRELSFIQRESELLVERLTQRLKWQNVER